MKVIVAYPPNYAELEAAFDYLKTARRTLFTWGQSIYNPFNVAISPELVSHEAVHAVRQGSHDASISKWWANYMTDPQFRFDEEWPAHVAEYRRFCQRHADRNRRIAYLMNTVAKRIASPLYGGLITFEEARTRLLAIR